MRAQVQRSVVMGCLCCLVLMSAAGQSVLGKGPAIPDSSVFKEPYRTGKLLYRDRFTGDLSRWVTETPLSPPSRVSIEGGRLVIDVAAGATVWFRQPLEGNILITFTREVMMGGGSHDRLSDLNCFWMAMDPRSERLFTRHGVFSQYDSLLMYYVGIGGNRNRTTRFRKYMGTGERRLLGEYTDSAHLLIPNKVYRVAIAVFQGRTECFVDGVPFFAYRDPHPLTGGYFGFRTTQSRQRIDDFRVYRLVAKKHVDE